MKKVYILATCLSYLLHSYSQVSPNALYFDGIDDYVSLSYPDYYFENIGSYPFTIEAWVKDDQNNPWSEEAIISTRDESGFSTQGFKLCITNGNLAFFSPGIGYGGGA